MLEMSGDDIVKVFENAVHNTADRLHIANPNDYSVDALMLVIQRTDSVTHGLLKDFVEAYRDWFALDRQYDTGSLDAQKKANLMAKIQVRDLTRQALLQRFDALP